MLGITGRSDWRYLLRHSDEPGRAESRAPEPSYYATGAEHGEPPGLWWGQGAEGLGQRGEVDHDVMATIYGELVDPRNGEQLGNPPRKYATYEERLLSRLAAEPDAMPERRREIEDEARRSHRKAVHYFDLTFSPPKSWSVYHAALERAGRHDEAAALWQSWLEGVGAGLEYLQREAGYSRAGYHGIKAGGRTSGRWVDGHDFVVSLWRHHTSRDGDPQMHVHAAVLNRVLNDDGVWRTLDSNALHKARRAADAIAMRVAESEATRRLGVEFRSRSDGIAREITGVDPKVNDLFSTRRRAIKAELAELVTAYKERYGTPPSAYRLSLMAEQVTLATRRRKPDHPPTREQLLNEWENKVVQKLNDSLDGVVRSVDRHRSDTHHLPAFDPQRVIDDSLAAVQNRKAVWNRHDLRVEIDKHLPDNLGGVDKDTIVAVIDELTDNALSPGTEAIKLSIPELVPAPPELRRADGRSTYEPHDPDRFATKHQLLLEEQLIAAARTTGAPSLDRERADELIAHYGLTGSQADAVKGILTSGRRIDVMVGYAGAGKSYTAGKLAELWETETGKRVFGLTTAERARQVLAEEGIARGANITKFLDGNEAAAKWLAKDRALLDDIGKRIDQGRATPKQLEAFAKAVERVAERENYEIRRGDLVIVDEGSMVATADLGKIKDIVEKAGAKLVIAGDDAQLGAVESGGAMRLLAKEVGAYEIVEVRRFAAEWEREASVRLRSGDAPVLGEYDRRGRFVDGTAEDMQAAVLRGYLSDYLDGRRTLMIVPTNELAAQLSSQAREELVRLGKVESAGVPLHNGTVAGTGDLIQLRKNAYDIRDEHDHPLINREVYLATRKGNELFARRLLGTDDFGRQRYGPEVRLPGKYVASNVELAYASTAHSAQGRTVDTGHALIDGAMSRESLYVDMSRGVHSNVGYVVTVAEVDDGIEPEHPDRFAVLAGVLEREGAQQSATEVQRAEVAAAESLARLSPIWHDQVATQTAENYKELLRHAVGDEKAAEIAADDASGALWRQLRSAELAGVDPDRLLRQVVHERELDTAESSAQVLSWRVARRLEGTEPTSARTYLEKTPARDDDIGVFTRKIAEAMDRRVEVLGQQAAETQPPWTSRLGPVPEDPLDRLTWTQRAGQVAAYREAYGYDHETDPLGPAPRRGSVDARAAWQAAYTALGEPEDQRSVAERTDGELRNLIGDYEREEGWAPAFVDDELRNANLAARDYRERLVQERAAAEAKLHGGPDDEARAASRMYDLEILSRRTAERAQALEEIAEARSAWYEETADARTRAQLAREELARRQLVTQEPESDRTVDEPEPDPTTQLEPELIARGRHRTQEPVAPARPDPERAPDITRSPEPETRRRLDTGAIAAELQRAREAARILAERQADRERAAGEAAAERDREYARRRDADGHEIDHPHHVDDPDYERDDAARRVGGEDG